MLDLIVYSVLGILIAIMFILMSLTDWKVTRDMSNEHIEEHPEIGKTRGQAQDIIYYLRRNAQDISLAFNSSLIYQPSLETLKLIYPKYKDDPNIYDDLFAYRFLFHCCFPVFNGYMYELSPFEYGKLKRWIKKNKSLFISHEHDHQVYTYNTYFKVVLQPYLFKLIENEGEGKYDRRY